MGVDERTNRIMYKDAPNYLWCGGDGCAVDEDKVTCKDSNSNLWSCGNTAKRGYEHVGYGKGNSCLGIQNMRRCKKKNIEDPDWNITREKYRNDPYDEKATDDVVKCCTDWDGLTERERQDCGQLYKGGVTKDCNLFNKCYEPQNIIDPLCTAFAKTNKDSKYKNLALPWYSTRCSMFHQLTQGPGKNDKHTRESLGKDGCFGKHMEADGYEHTRKFYQQYIDSMDGFIADDPHAINFCTNPNVIDKEWCDATLERQCRVGSGNETREECSCFHSMTDNGPGYKNFKDQGIDYKDLLKKDPAAAGVMAGTLQPICALDKCRDGIWKTKNQKDRTICPSCYQTNYNEGRGNSTQTNKCVIKYIDGEFVVEEENGQPSGSSVDPPPEPPRPPIPKKKNSPEPQQGGSVEPSSAQMAKACGKFRKGPDCKKLSGLSVGLIASSAVLLIFLLMLFLFF